MTAQTSISRNRVLNLISNLYFAMLLFFLFVGFNRSGRAARGGDFYNLSLEPIAPFRFDGLLHNPFMLFQLGNVLAFIPCGLLLPLLVRWGFFRLTGTFVAGMFLVETVQMLTRLGSFDVNDVVLNTLGYLIGSIALIVGRRFGGTAFSFKRTAYTAISVLLLVGVMLAAPSAAGRLIQGYTEGQVVGLESLQPSGTSIHWEEVSAADLPDSATVAEAQTFKLYAWPGAGTETLTYELDGGYIRFQAYGTVQGGTGGGIRFILDGEPMYEFAYAGENGDIFDTEKVEFDVRGAKRLTLELTRPSDGSEGQVLLWGAGLVERKH